jgi:cytochrome c5
MQRALAAILAASAVLASCAAEPPATDPIARGRQVYRELDCGACHEAGFRNLWRPVGPPLEHVGTVAETRRPGVPAEEYLRQSVTEPGAYLVPGYPDSMPRGLTKGLSQDDLGALVRYLGSLR